MTILHKPLFGIYARQSVRWLAGSDTYGLEFMYMDIIYVLIIVYRAKCPVKCPDWALYMS